jgi:hypothetical protein
MLGSPQNIHCSCLDHCPKFRFMKKCLRESGPSICPSELGVPEEQAGTTASRKTEHLFVSVGLTLSTATGCRCTRIFLPLPLDLCLVNQSVTCGLHPTAVYEWVMRIRLWTLVHLVSRIYPKSVSVLHLHGHHLSYHRWKSHPPNLIPVSCLFSSQSARDFAWNTNWAVSFFFFLKPFGVSYCT